MPRPRHRKGDPEAQEAFKKLPERKTELEQHYPEAQVEVWSFFAEQVGANTYVYPDGSIQTERRSYTVRRLQGELKLTSSEFVEVTQARSSG